MFAKAFGVSSKKVRDEVDFRKSRHQIFDQVGTIIFDGSSEACL